MSTVRRWRFTALEFRTLWDATGRDVLPYPLQHQFTTEFRSETRRLRQAAAKTLQPQLDDDLLRAVHVLFAPEARVELAGFTGTRRDRKLRAHAGVHHEHGAIAVQEPGPDNDHGGDVIVSFLPDTAVAREVVAVLPDCGPGRGEQLRVAAEDLEKPAAAVRDSWQTTPRQELQRFFNRPTTCTTHIGVYALGSPDNRHTQGRKDFQITDFENDGRYVTVGDNVIVTKPTTSDRIATTLQDMISRTVTAVRDGVYLPR
ncbi:ESX secretion-associated protein EspG [Nocardia cyriacigeorgica]|uniref:ESX secretion-associated protein EspG n=1 Tax=Nocardia cyriacigeorgica (strain GUH-2) TaxID=1127134 RepID=H6R1I3_NOCCG|nr:ESX secretion-associated protein EspG [Nocardia cyriacigeorgica]MBF6097814.1 ESX secretion-associated protein EspG [Nocardia cyriacigeorgica]BDT89249.1 hypothetical protein FMUAM8_50130 [Nocardia cyriacigeorgica]CCF65562.1 conserved protein of unknown function [Nocardia cyriacigeorgica GUH-2]